MTNCDKKIILVVLISFLICVTEVEAKPLPTAENGKDENKTINKSAKKEKEKETKVTDMTSKTETELSASKLTTEVTIGHTEIAMTKESFLKTKHAKDKMINNDILKGDINSVLHIEMDRKQGNEKSSTNEGNTDKLIHDLGKPSISNIEGNMSQILGGKTEKHDVLAAIHNNTETVRRLDLSRRDVIKRKKTITASQDGNKMVQRQTSISNSQNVRKPKSKLRNVKEYKELKLNSKDNIVKSDTNTHIQTKQMETPSSMMDTNTQTIKTTQSVRNITSTNAHNHNSGTELKIQKQSDGKVNTSTFNNTLHQSFEKEQHTSKVSTHLSTEEKIPSGTTTELTTITTKRAIKSLADTCKGLKRKRIPLPPMCKKVFTDWN